MNQYFLISSALASFASIYVAPVVNYEADVSAFDRVQSTQTQVPETAVEDIIVEGRPLREATHDYVDRMIAAPRGAGAAAWHQTVCIGVGNLRAETAQIVIDGIAGVAASLNLSLGSPGCEPRVFIIFAADADAVARDIVASRRREFRIGISGSDRGSAALEAFQTTNAPIRWWPVSAPVNVNTGQVAERLPGRAPLEDGTITRPSELGGYGAQTLGSRLSSPIRDDLAQIIVIVDIDAIEGVSTPQLIAYLSMVSLAQIAPDADPGSYDSILGLFRQDRAPPEGLTDWDRAFLKALYTADQSQRNPNFRLGSVADAMANEVRDQRSGD